MVVAPEVGGGASGVRDGRPRWRRRGFFRLASGRRIAGDEYPTILIGVGEKALAAAREVVQARNGFSVLGMVAQPWERPSPRLAGIPILGVPGDLPHLVRQCGARAVVVAQDDALGSDLTPLLLACRLAGVRVLDLPRLFEHLSGRIPLEHVEDGWLLAEIFSAGRNVRYLRLKRVGDVLFSAVALTLFGLALPALALAIRANSGKSVFFRQDRVGYLGRHFRAVKLRTMVEDAEAEGEPVWAESDDQRVTRVGRFLRLTRLDEVPQFWNVLRGEMSVVGPRPERPFFVEKLRHEIRHYDWRHVVRPGITGWAQVKQGYAASFEESFRKLEMDFYYIKNRNFLLDLRILAKTVGVVLSRKGAR